MLGVNTSHVISSMVYIWGRQMAVRLLFHPTTMDSLIKLHPTLDIFSKKGAIESPVSLVKLDFTSCGVSDLYTALRRFDKRFSSIWQDVTDPVSSLAQNFSIEALARLLCHDIAKAKLTLQTILPDPFGSGEVSSHNRSSHCAVNISSA